MNNLQIFNNDRFGQVRTFMQNGEPWFVGKDVCNILGYSDTFGALNKHVDVEDKRNCQNRSFESPRGLTVINESGLYSLILRSKLPGANQFKRWVTHEVLPNLRKTGTYSIDAKPIVTLYDGKLYARFSDVAAFFGETIEAICNIADDYSRVGFSDYFQYPNSEYFMTKDGLALVMKDKSKVKEYVKAFEEMEHQLELIKPKYMELPPIEIANNRPGRMRRKKVGMEILTCTMAVLEANRASMIQKQIWFRNLAKQFGLNPTDREIYQLEKELAEKEETMKVTLEFPIKRTIELKGKK